MFLLKLFLIIIFIVSAITSDGKTDTPLENEFPWERKCAQDRCICDDTSYSVTCKYNSSYDEADFVDLSFENTNRLFNRLILDSYPIIPTNAFSKVTFSTTSPLFIILISVKAVEENAFQSMGNLDSLSSYDLDINFQEADRPDLINFAFRNIRLKSLNFYLIYDEPNSNYLFNLDALAGAISIETLSFNQCRNLKGFKSSLSQVNQRTLIDTMEFQEIDTVSIDNSTWFTNSIQLENVEKFIWTGSRVQEIAPFTFAYMNSLKYLTLSGNNILQLDTNAFQHANSQILELDLSNNPIEKISPFAFEGLDRLAKLYLDNNSLPIMFENILDSIKSLEYLKFANQKTLPNFNWNSVLDHQKLNSLDVSNFDAGKEALLDSQLSAKIKTFINNQLKNFYIYGYEFTIEDSCNFLPLSSNLNQSNFPLMHFNQNHPCSCFVIQTFKFYRMQFTQAEFNTFANGIRTSPICYQKLYDLNNYFNLTVISNELLVEENGCNHEINVLCAEVSTSISSQSTSLNFELQTTSTTNSSDGEINTDEKFVWSEILLISIGAAAGIITITSIVILIVAICICCKMRNNNNNQRNNFELEGTAKL